MVINFDNFIGEQVSQQSIKMYLYTLQ